MLKIIEVRTAPRPEGEYVVLQNEGLVSLSLCGWALCSESVFSPDSPDWSSSFYMFDHDVNIRPYTRVVLFTGSGEDGWVPTIDGKQAFLAYWNRRQSVWKNAQTIHILRLAGSRRVIQLNEPQLKEM